MNPGTGPCTRIHGFSLAEKTSLIDVQCREPAVPALTRPLLHDAEIDELWGTGEYIRHRFPSGLQPFLALRVPLARTCLLLAVEHPRTYTWAGSFWSCMMSVRTRPDPGRSAALICSFIRGHVLAPLTPDQQCHVNYYEPPLLSNARSF